MKQKRKPILRLLTFSILLILYSCSEDLYENELKTNTKFKVEIVNSNALIKNKRLMKSLNSNKVLKTTQFGKIVSDTINGISIDTDNVKYLEGKNFNSYTFNILDQETEALDNLVLMSQANGSYKPYVLRYNLTAQERIALQNGEDIDFTGKTKVLKLNDSNIVSDIFGKMQVRDCIMIYNYEEQIEIIPCSIDGCLEHPWASYTSTWVLVGTMSCSDTGGGGGGNIGDSGGEIGTSPHGGGGSNTTVANPCNKIKNQNTKFPSLKQSLVTLATTTSQNYENGTFIDNTATATTVNPVQTIPSNTANGGTIPLNMNPTNSYVMIAHTHDSYGTDGTGTYSVFSWDDLTTINNLLVNNHIDNSSFVFYVITADGTRYALTVDSPSNLSSFFYNPSNLPFGTQIDTQKLLNMQKVFQKYYDKSKNGLITTTSTAVNDKSNFLKFIKEANLGITLFEVDATFSTYQKLSISNSGVVTPTPCN